MIENNASNPKSPGTSGRRRDLIISLSLANILFLRVWRELLFASHIDSYWMPLYGPPTYFAVLLNITWITIILYFVARFVRKVDKPALTLVGRLSFLLLLLFPLEFFRKFGIKQSTLNFALDYPFLACVFCLFVVLLVGYILVARLKATTHVVASVLVALSPFAAITIPRATYHGVTAICEDENSKNNPQVAISKIDRSINRPRIIWLLFDELDSRIAFSERPDDISLPSFDRFQSECITALDGASHGQSTLRAIPSFLTGKLVTEISFPNGNDLNLRFCGKEELPFVSFGKTPTLFSDVLERGGENAVVGMYHPYERIFVEQAGYRSAYSMNTYTTKESGSVLNSMVAQILGITPLFARINGIKMYEGILRECVAVTTNPRYDLVFAHISVPHGPHVFDREKGSFTLVNFSPDGYLDSLVLADQFLNTVRQGLENEGMWDDSVVLITSDHELRQVEFGDKKRVQKTPFLIKMPMQKTPYTFPHPISPKVIARNLLVGVLDGEVKTPDDVLLWLDRATLPAEPTVE